MQEPKFRIEKRVNTDIFPQTIIKLRASDEILKERAKKMPEAAVPGSHYNDDGMIRRLLNFRKTNNNEGSGAHSHLLDFFQEHGSEMVLINFETESYINMSQDDVYKEIIGFVERVI